MLGAEMDTTQATDAHTDSNTNQEDKKRKRGRRGGKGRNVPVQELTVTADTEGTPKKTRRSKKGKTIDPVQEDTIDFQQFQQDQTPHDEFGIVDPETRNYFQSIETLLASEVEEMELLVENVFEGLSGKEMMISTDFEGSRILEKLLRASSDFQIRVFADRLNGK
jgi:nucleolar protein 9